MIFPLGERARRAARGVVLGAHATDTDDHYLRAAAAVRLPLAVLLALVGPVIPDEQVRQPAYLAVALGYLVIGFGWMVVLPRFSNRTRIAQFSPLADLIVLVVLSLLSGGATSLLQPAFFLLPLTVAFSELPWLTGLFGSLTAGAYLVIWLNAPVNSGAPVTWLHFGFLVWLALAATVLSEILARRGRRLARLVVIQRQLVNQSLKMEEEHRAQFAEELHDGPLQLLLVSRMDLEDIASRRPPVPGNAPLVAAADQDPAADEADLARVSTQLRECADEIRAVVSGLHPQVLGQLGIAAGIEELADQHRRRTGTPVTFMATPTTPSKADQLIHGLARELLANIAKHAHAQHVTITYGPGLAELTPHGGPCVTLQVEDDGVGFDPSVIAQRVAAGHIGLAAHAARILGAGGTFTITPATPHGTVVTATVPVAP